MSCHADYHYTLYSMQHAHTADETECQPKPSSSLPAQGPTPSMTPLSSLSSSVSLISPSSASRSLAVSSSVAVSSSGLLPSSSPLHSASAAIVGAKSSAMVLGLLVPVVVWRITH